jgi:hypothetical protein
VGEDPSLPARAPGRPGRPAAGGRARIPRAHPFASSASALETALEHIGVPGSAALDVVRTGGMTDSEAVRTALREAAARRRVRSAIRVEVRRVAADESDREEMRVIREQMAELAPPSSA